MTGRLVSGGRARTRQALGIGLVALGVVTSTLSTPIAQAATPPPASGRTTVAAQVHAPIPTLHWRRCGKTFQCATATVPLDYDHPHGATITLNLLRRPANHPARRIGSLFVNPGGPGGPSTEVVDIFAQLLGPAVRNRFDVIGIDPRGVGGSTPVVCRTTERPPRFPRNIVPFTLRQARPLLRFNSWERRACATGGNAILDHMTTADTARDMDLIRQAVGDQRLSYYGISYGSYLGATYAALFPGRVRAVIIDGVLDPIAWSTGRPGFGRKLAFSTRLKSGVGSWDALTTAFSECDRVGRKRCPLAGHSTQRWLRIIHTLRQGPVKVGGRRITYSDVVTGTLGPLYSRSSYRYLMRSIDRLYDMMFTSGQGVGNRDLARAFKQMAQSTPGPYGLAGPAAARARTGAGTVLRFSPSFEAIACADSINPLRPRAWLHSGKVADAQGPWFGRLWTWFSSPCARWPGSSADAFRGPWHGISTASPLLIVGNFHDPATPISGARVANTLFLGSRMFSLDTWGHGAIGESRCVTRRFSRYLVGGRLPLNGLVCQPDKQLFPIRR